MMTSSRSWLLGRDAVHVHRLLFVDADGAEPASSDGSDGQGHNLKVILVGFAAESGCSFPPARQMEVLGHFSDVAHSGVRVFRGPLGLG